MNIDFSRKFCPDCHTYVRAEKRKASNIFHLIMTIITCGAWVFVWLFSAFSLSLNSWQCPMCGSKSLKGKAPRLTADGREPLSVAIRHEVFSVLSFFLVLGLAIITIFVLTGGK